MGRSHVISGITVALAATAGLKIPHPALTLGSWHTEAGWWQVGARVGELSAPAVALAALVVGLATLLPDWDTPSSLASTALPPLTSAVSRPLTALGHRTFTHAPVGFAAFAAAFGTAGAPVVSLGGLMVRPGNALVLALGAAVAARALKVHRTLLLWAFGIGGGLTGALLPATSLWFMPAAVAVGMWVHRLGDALTTQGAPFVAWPLPGPRLRLPLLGDAGSTREKMLVALMGVYSVLAVVWTLLSGWA